MDYDPSEFRSLTEKVRKRIVELVEVGNKPVDAFQAEGISRSTYIRWRRAVQLGHPTESAFESDIARARSRFKVEALATVQAGDGQGVGFGKAKATLEVLGRLFPEEWAPKVSVILEEAESLWFDDLQAVCADPDVFERVRTEGNLGPVFVALCERQSGRAGGEEARDLPSVAVGAVH